MADDVARQTTPVRVAQPLPAYLKKRHAAWHASAWAENAAWYRSLADGGQRPRAMLITCCDSRSNVVEMFGAEPGDLFVVRNVAAIVPPHEPDHRHHGTSAAIEYAVTALKVAHIVITGHSSCGGVKACHDMCAGLAPALDAPDSYIGRWIDLIKPAYVAIQHMDDAAARQTALEQRAVVQSLSNLLTFPFVESAVTSGALTLHGTWHDIGSGRLHVYDGATDRFD